MKAETIVLQIALEKFVLKVEVNISKFMLIEIGPIAFGLSYLSRKQVIICMSYA